MKKNYFMLAAATMMFAACAETDLVNEINEAEAQYAIGFETFSNKVTRALSSTDAVKLEKYHTSFGVWAYKTVDTDKEVMGNYKVQTTDDGATWVYAGVGGQTLKYWDKQASGYDFYAYAPYAEAGVTINNGVISITDGEYAARENLQSTWSTELNKSDFSTDTDWMIADPIEDRTDYVNTVDEVFKHTMSKLIVILNSTDVATGTEVEVTNVSVNNVHGKGEFNGTKWTASDTGKSIEGKVGKFESTANYYSMEYLLIPSDDDPTFSITYKVNGDTCTVTETAIKDITGFVGNTCYTLTATIGLQPIKFIATAVDFTQAGGSVSIQ